MCGIAGLVRLDGADLTLQDQADLARMSSRIHHRGPDEQRSAVMGPCGISFNRLSINDLQSGMQPFIDPSRRLLACVNGEIFNHIQLRSKYHETFAFTSRSDCEVILPLFAHKRTECTRALHGMFGIACWDQDSRQLFLARDRLGIKPLYYAVTSGYLLFGSEMKALFAHPQCPSEFDWPAALTDQFHKQNFFPHMPLTTYFKGVNAINAGEQAVLDMNTGTLSVSKYWDAASFLEDRDLHGEIQSYREVLTAAVTDCLMSDAQIGIFLSGGIDSSIIASIAAKHRPDLVAFSVLSRSTLENGDVLHANMMARSAGIPLHQVVFNWENHFLTPHTWREVLRSVESFHAGLEQVYKWELHRYAREQFPNLKVMLLGQGSDEFNGGYSALEGASHGAPNRTWSEFQQKISNGLRRVDLRSLDPAYSWLESMFDGGLLSDAFILDTGTRETPESDGYRRYLQYRVNTLQMYNLPHEDRTASAHGIEDRVPFLDHRLVELCLKVPKASRERLFWNKSILRQAAVGLVPDAIRLREKGPFYGGLAVNYSNLMLLDILRADDFGLVEEALGGSAVVAVGSVRQAIARAAATGEFHSLRVIGMLVNMGLLAGGLLKDAPQPVELSLRRAIRITNNDESYSGFEQIVGPTRRDWRT